MAKFRVYLGAFVTKLMKRQIVVSAPDEDTAIQRAKERFRYCCRNNAVYTECDSIEVDLVEMEGKG